MLLELQAGGGVRFLIDFWNYRKAQRILKESVKSYGWKALAVGTISSLRRKKASDTLFILGSGSSVNHLSDTAWQEVARHVSVGINHWTLHQFVPDIYAVETVSDRRSEEGKSQSLLEVDHLNHLQVLGRPEVLESSAIIMCLAPRTDGENAQVLEIPNELKSRTFVYYRYTPFTREEKNIAKDYLRGLLPPFSRSSRVVVPDSGATLVRLLGIALRAGFKKVVLLGIDLSTTYFWEEDDSSLIHSRFRHFPQPMSGGSHETLSRIGRPFSAVEAVRGFKSLYRSRGVFLYSKSFESELNLFLGPPRAHPV